MKLLKKKIEFTTKEGEKKSGYNFYIEFDNGRRVCIKNSFKDDYKLLGFLAELIKD